MRPVNYNHVSSAWCFRKPHHNVGVCRPVTPEDHSKRKVRVAPSSSLTQNYVPIQKGQQGLSALPLLKGSPSLQPSPVRRLDCPVPPMPRGPNNNTRPPPGRDPVTPGPSPTSTSGGHVGQYASILDSRTKQSRASANWSIHVGHRQPYQFVRPEQLPSHPQGPVRLLKPGVGRGLQALANSRKSLRPSRGLSGKFRVSVDGRVETSVGRLASDLHYRPSPIIIRPKPIIIQLRKSASPLTRKEVRCPVSTGLPAPPPDVPSNGRKPIVIQLLRRNHLPLGGSTKKDHL